MIERVTAVEQYGALHQVSPDIAGLPLGVVRQGTDGRLQAYFGAAGVEYLTPYDTAELRNGAIQVAMYTIDGRFDFDYAQVTVTPPAYNRTGTERAMALRFGGTDPRTLIERTPLQQFICRRSFVDIPLAGRARWLAIDPEGVISHGIYDDREPNSNSVAMFGEGWTFAWVVEGSRPFVFGELCRPRFIDAPLGCPSGEAGIVELENPEQQAALPADFRRLFDYWQTGEQLRERL